MKVKFFGIISPPMSSGSFFFILCLILIDQTLLTLGFCVTFVIFPESEAIVRIVQSNYTITVHLTKQSSVVLLDLVFVVCVGIG